MCTLCSVAVAVVAACMGGIVCMGTLHSVKISLFSYTFVLIQKYTKNQEPPKAIAYGHRQFLVATGFVATQRHYATKLPIAVGGSLGLSFLFLKTY